MIDPKHFNDEIAKLLKLVDAKFGIQSDELSEAMRKIGRRLPQAAHRNAARLVEAQQQLKNPKIALQLDEKSLVKPYASLRSDLESYDPADRRKGAILGALGVTVFNLIMVVILLICVLIWRGFL